MLVFTLAVCACNNPTAHGGADGGGDGAAGTGDSAGMPEAPDGNEGGLDASASDGMDGAAGTDAGCNDVVGDPLNCGYCGHDCQGGTCSAGACQPVTLATQGGGAIAVDSTSVYWISATMTGPSPNGTVLKVPVDGGTVATLAAGQSHPEAIAVDSTNIFWNNIGDSHASTGSIVKGALGGGTVTTLVAGLSSPFDIAIDPTSVYWLPGAGAAGGLMRIPLDGGTVTTFASGGAAAVAVDSTSAYLGGAPASSATVLKITLADGALTTLVPGSPTVSGIAVDPTRVYWAQSTTAAKSVMSVPLNGGSVTTLVSWTSPDTLGSVAVDATSVYYFTEGSLGNGPIQMVPLAGGAARTVASGQYFGGIALDSTSVYWTNNYMGTGTLMKVAKP